MFSLLLCELGVFGNKHSTGSFSFVSGFLIVFALVCKISKQRSTKQEPRRIPLTKHSETMKKRTIV